MMTALFVVIGFVAAILLIKRLFPPAPKKEQRTPITIKATSSDGTPPTAEEVAHVEALSAHPIFASIKPMLANGDWGAARRYLQKCAYGIKDQPVREQMIFKEIMTAFARSDPLYKLCLDSVLPVVRSNPGIKQTALYAHMKAAPDTEHARYVLYFADELGHLVRRKKGNSYQVYLPGQQ